jgi:hypothetical protein
LRDGRGDAAAVGQVAYWHAAETLLSYLPQYPETWNLEQRELMTPHLQRVRILVHEVRAAVRTLDYRYLRKLADAVQAQKKGLKKDDGLEDIEYIFEAFLFLRNRDGQGSPLPLKGEVKSYAALIRAFKNRNLMGKLPKFFWDPFRTTPMPGPALTDREFDEVNGVQQDYLKKRRPNYWTDLFRNAGLRKLQQTPRAPAGE